MMNAKGRVSVAIIVVVAFFSGVMFTTVGANIFGLDEGIGTRTLAADGTAIDRDLSSVADFQDAFMEVAERVNPTVVQISSERLVGGENGQVRNPLEGTPFEDFFGGFEGPQQPRPQTGLGSGVIIRSDGYIITNNHVVEGADVVTVVMMDGTRHEAEVIGTDAVSDVAVIKVEANNLPFISLGNSDDVRVGQWVMAFGSPLSASLSNTVTAGIVSATGRLQGGFATPDQEGPSQIHNFIQTDAAINPGNSGGPLVDLNGRLVGINTAIVSRTGGNLGIGFAIPVNTVDYVAEQLIETGHVERARLGVSFGPASESLIEALDLPRGAAVISGVTQGSAAEQAGMEPGDIIVSVNDQELTNHLQLSQRIGAMQPGDTAEFTVVRNEERISFDVQLGGWENADGPDRTADRSSGEASARTQMMEELGFRLSNLTPELAQRAGLEEEVEGVMITDINPSSDAYRSADLRRGQIIIEIDRQRVRNLDEFEEAYRDIDGGDSFLVRLYTGPDQTYITALTKPE